MRRAEREAMDQLESNNEVGKLSSPPIKKNCINKENSVAVHKRGRQRIGRNPLKENQVR